MLNQKSKDYEPRPRRACQFCHKRKIKCNREAPECSACRYHQQICSYKEDHPNLTTASPSSSTSASINGRSWLLQARQARSAVASRFLDHQVFWHGQDHLPTTSGASYYIPNYVAPFLDVDTDLQQAASCYYQLIHPWLPIISKRKVYESLLNPLLPRRSDTVFLCLCMKVVCWSPGSKDSCTPEYFAATRLFTEVQAAGILSLEVLQGCVLLVVYELGHALYPAAQTSVGSVLRYASAIRLGWTRTADDTDDTKPWTNIEERRRVWWAIFMLERLGNLGSPQQELLTPEPALTEHLPGQEIEWEPTYTSQDHVHSTLSSPPESLGRFASVAQASYLLGRVFRYVQKIPVELHLQEAETSQLEKTLYALISYSESRSGRTDSVICYQNAISYCALLTLSAPYLQHRDLTMRRRARETSAHASSIAATVATAFLSQQSADMTHGDIPPFMLPWLYMAGAYLQTQNSMDEFKVIEMALKTLDSKWKSAGIYLDLLTARKVIQSMPQ